LRLYLDALRFPPNIPPRSGNPKLTGIIGGGILGPGLKLGEGLYGGYLDGLGEDGGL
jgi:hypothetical protein